MDFPGRFSEHILAEKTHILNLSFTVKGIKESFGGTGGNIAYNLSMLGEKPKLIAVVGKDFSKYKNWLLKNKIDISGVKIDKHEVTAHANIITDQDDNQITIFYPGSKIKIFPNLFIKENKNILAVIAPDIVARMVKYAKIFKRNHLPYIFDPGQQTPYYNSTELKYSISGSEMLIGNDYEIQLILDKLKIKLEQLKTMVKILVITKGGQGSEIYIKNKKIIIKAVKKKKGVDTTGAGDAYRAGFIKGLIMGWPLVKCARLGSVVSAYAVENYGTQAHKFT